MAYAAANFLVPSGYHEICATLRGTSLGSLYYTQHDIQMLAIVSYLKMLIVLADGGSSPNLSLELSKYSS